LPVQVVIAARRGFVHPAFTAVAPATPAPTAAVALGIGRRACSTLRGTGCGVDEGLLCRCGFLRARRALGARAAATFGALGRSRCIGA
jgi:hypothetical protein